MKELLKKDCFSLTSKSVLPFSIIAPFYYKVRGKELSHSEILKSLLEPTMNHLHRMEFLDLFLRDIGLSYDSSILSNIEIETERPTKTSEKSNSRPVDILISYHKDEDTSTKYAIIVENKLNYAVDQTNQINDYHDGLVRENYHIEKIVYMHVDSGKTIENTDTREELKENTCNYNVSSLIKTLISMKDYSYITEYKYLLENLSYSFMSLNEARKIQEDLNNEELKKIIEISDLIQKDSWNEAKYKKIVEELSIKELLHSYDKKYSTYYFEDYKFWVEVWFYSTYNKIYICSKEEKEIIKVNNKEYKLWGYQQGRYFYESNQNKFDYPSEGEKLLKELVFIIENSRKE